MVFAQILFTISILKRKIFLFFVATEIMEGWFGNMARLLYQKVLM